MNPESAEAFTFVGWDLDTGGDAVTLRCTYAIDDETFTEVVGVDTIPAMAAGPQGASDQRPAPGGGTQAAVESAARLVFLLAGVSYFKAASPPLVTFASGQNDLASAERELLWAHHVDGLGEYAFRNDLNLTGLRLDAADRPPGPLRPPPDHPTRPLIPFGGGIDSIVTVEGVRAVAPDADTALFVMSRRGDRFDAIEAPLEVSGLPVVRAWRALDPKILESAARGYRNGHVPVTGILSAVALLAAAVHDRDAVVMSNEWSASAPNLEHAGRPVNHQWSKSLAFEGLLRATLATSPLAHVNYHSWLRPRSELWVARRFAELSGYHRAFRSCNRSFALDPARRLQRWCGQCDKCCFIDLILSPYVDARTLAQVFDGAEPLHHAELRPAFAALLGLSDDAKPFECVGDVDECRVAVSLAARRGDRGADHLVQTLADEVAAVIPGDPAAHATTLLAPLGPHFIPPGLAPADLPPADTPGQPTPDLRSTPSTSGDSRGSDADELD
jgi:hypothetical protein